MEKPTEVTVTTGCLSQVQLWGKQKGVGSGVGGWNAAQTGGADSGLSFLFRRPQSSIGCQGSPSKPLCDWEVPLHLTSLSTDLPFLNVEPA